ncbi:putative chromatin regulator PHD family [Helianthus annuus]|uniref:Chromatin regulator PHD family n=1 Tax=Helianthus annuus TaxID=4232 RepID=A0A251TAW2_HELAN|nr:E3 ubiquitin-protein ligase RFI2 isoform X1 [Helianthus annuus]KAF5781949.1 putative chromatin regulator PHD family [Helianthus annuus]KAJ0501493.1 putative chromatin regulator PHD family [Helianthus annuus]KAJ0509297.1 putative chromatin regulator PHD family [Helianthus annuus]KAJ0685412.1 putative chromatin regulator PHD family [Helianthus annuus]KAJ0689303.1 putative chromatin regulator PHD family [Helianthus annuus]
MGLEDPDLVDDGDGGSKAAAAAASVSCSICLEVVADSGDRSMAKLQCGHQFHLDCIGSAFNAKGAMQCPNCRKIEKGQWLYANGCRPYHEVSMDDWTHDDDLYDLTYPETTSMWCPFGGFTRLAASFDEGEFPTTAYHDFLGQHAIFTEHATAMSSATHLCPYIAYVQPVHPSSSSSASGSVADGPTYNNNNNHNNNSSNNQWNSSQSASSEIPNSYALPNMDVRYHTTIFPSSHNRVGGADQPSIPSVMPPRSVRNNADIPRSGSYVHPFLPGQSSVAARAPGSVGSSMIPPHPGSAARARERAQALQAYSQQPSSLLGLRTPIVSGSRRSNSQAQMGQAGSSSDHIRGGGIYYIPTSGSTTRSGFQEAESSMPGPFHHNTWERDPPPLPHPHPHPHPGVGQGWGFHQGGGGSGAFFRLRYGSERSPSQGHYR